ncbi:MAG: divergent polysaccharide deacetylase family protein, partial [Thermoanaerobaculales bacterium]|nr:divergent polysaccharide deacetylase family protein [Thermoanaerobaculales bacterium]
MPDKKRKRKSTATRPWLAPALGVALLGVGAALWTLLHPVAEPELVTAEAPVDFAQVIRDLAVRRQSAGDRLREDDPIRKEGTVFVRTWRITAPDQVAAEGVWSDLVAETSRWSGTFHELPRAGSDVARFRVDFPTEAFDIHISVRAVPSTVATPSPIPVVPTPTPRPQPPPGAKGRLAILLDDAGQKMDLVSVAADLPQAIGIAVLPFLPVSSETATTLHRAGHEIWLHLPMEPMGYPGNNPGLGAVFVSMTEDEVRTTVHSALNNVPH